MEATTFKSILTNQSSTSKQIVTALLNNKTDNNLATWKQQIVTLYDIQKMLSTNIASIKSTQWCYSHCMQDEPYTVLTFDKQTLQCIAIAVRTDKFNDDYVEPCHTSFLDKFDIVEQWDDIMEQPDMYTHVVIDDCMFSERQCHHSMTADAFQARQVERNKQRRLEQLVQIKLAKAILECIDVDTLEHASANNKLIDADTFLTAVINSYNALWPKMQVINPDLKHITNISFSPSIKDFEFDKDTNKLFVDIKMPWTASTIDGELITYKYSDLLPTPCSFFSDENESTRLLIAAVVALLKCMLQVEHVIGRLSYNQNDIHYILQNIACQQHFDRGLLEQFNLYNTFGFTKRLICK